MNKLLSIAAAVVLATVSWSALPKLTIKGEKFVDPHGKAVTLHGVNLGNWLMLEMWMLGWSGYRDQHEFLGILNRRFGAAEADRLMDLYRESWMMERDWKIIRSFGMNVVRLPMDYRLMEDDTNPMHLRKDAWQWIDKAVNEAEAHGLYVILDMHGVQGGQSPYDHTGQADQNKLWSEPKNQERAAWLWGQIARRYRDRSAVVAYDLYNEPYGGTDPQIVALFKRLYGAVRRADPEKLVFAHGNTGTFTFYGDPKKNGWHNVGFQMHYYPGLFGNGNPTLLTQARHLAAMERVEQQQNQVNVPFLVGEFNVVFTAAGGASTMRRTYDLYAKNGWVATMWCYKLMSEEGGIGEGGSWGLVTSALPAPKLDIRTASKQEIERVFRGYATMPLAIYGGLRTMLTAKNPVLPPLPAVPASLAAVSYQDVLPGWQTADIGKARKGGLRELSDGMVELYGGGADIWGGSDQFRYLYQPVEGDFELTATLDSLVDTNQYAKAGLMMRDGLEPDAAFRLISVFPSGEVQFAERAAKESGAAGIGDMREGKFPIELRLIRRGNQLRAAFRPKGGAWTEFDAREVPTGRVLVGVVALSHAEDELTKATYRNVKLVKN